MVEWTNNIDITEKNIFENNLNNINETFGKYHLYNTAISKEKCILVITLYLLWILT